MGNSFIDDQEKMLDFFFLSRSEFLQSYSYLTQDDYRDTECDVINKFKYWEQEQYDDEPDVDGRTLYKMILEVVAIDRLNDPEKKSNEYRRGKWLTPYGSYSYRITTYQCSLCGYKTDTNSNYCPACGARMRETIGGRT